MALYLFLDVLYQAIFHNVLKAAFLTHVLCLEGSHNGVLHKEMVMTVISYIVK